MCHEGKLEFVRKDINVGSEELDVKYWTLIYDEHLKTFGLNENHAKYMELLNKKAIYECEFIISDNRKVLNKIRQIEARIQALLSNNGESVSIGRLLMMLSKFQGYPVNKYTITVSEYFDLIENFKQSQQQPVE